MTYQIIKTPDNKIILNSEIQFSLDNFVKSLINTEPTGSRFSYQDKYEYSVYMSLSSKKFFIVKECFYPKEDKKYVIDVYFKPSDVYNILINLFKLDSKQAMEMAQFTDLKEF